MTGFVERKEYELTEIMDDDKDILDEFEEARSGYICDIINELGDGFTPVYNSKIWEGARDISVYIEEAKAQGLCEGDISLEQMFQSGFYMYYTQVLYNNMEAVVFNVLADKVNAYLNTLDEDILSKLEMDFEAEVEDKVSDVDNNDDMSIVDDYFESIKELIEEEIEAIKETDKLE